MAPTTTPKTKANLKSPSIFANLVSTTKAKPTNKDILQQELLAKADKGNTKETPPKGKEKEEVFVEDASEEESLAETPKEEAKEKVDKKKKGPDKRMSKAELEKHVLDLTELVMNMKEEQAAKDKEAKKGNKGNNKHPKHAKDNKWKGKEDVSSDEESIASDETVEEENPYSKVIDRSTSVGTRLYNDAVAPLPTKIALTPKGIHTMNLELQSKFQKYLWGNVASVEKDGKKMWVIDAHGACTQEAAVEADEARKNYKAPDENSNRS